jgi:cytochrome c553
MPRGLGLKVAVKLVLFIVVLGLAPAIAYPDAGAGEKKAQLCLLCHKPNNPMAYLPTLEGQTREYLSNQIKAYREKLRPDNVMQTNVAPLSDADIRDIAEYFASQEPIRASFNLDSQKVALGRSKARDLQCGTCHRAHFSGEKEVPRLAGLDPRYGSRQIVDFASGKRPHPYVKGMSDISSQDAECLAHFFAYLE